MSVNQETYPADSQNYEKYLLFKPPGLVLVAQLTSTSSRYGLNNYYVPAVLVRGLYLTPANSLTLPDLTFHLNCA